MGSSTPRLWIPSVAGVFFKVAKAEEKARQTARVLHVHHPGYRHPVFIPWVLLSDVSYPCCSEKEDTKGNTGSHAISLAHTPRTRPITRDFVC